MITMTPQEDSGDPRNLSHADRVLMDPWWEDGALRAIRELAESGHAFSAEDLRRAPIALPEPPHPAHWGAVFRKASRQRMIRPVGHTTSGTPSRHGGSLRLWRGERQRVG